MSVEFQLGLDLADACNKATANGMSHMDVTKNIVQASYGMILLGLGYSREQALVLSSTRLQSVISEMCLIAGNDLMSDDPAKHPQPSTPPTEQPRPSVGPSTE